MSTPNFRDMEYNMPMVCGALKATNILWDVDYDDDGELPTEIDIPEGMTDEDEISDYLSEVTGYCHQGYVLEENK